MKPEIVPVNDGDVLVFRNLDFGDDEDRWEEFRAALHKMYPESFILVFSGEETLETMPEDVLIGTLKDMIRHQKERTNAT